MCHNVFKDCPPQNLLSPLLNTLSQICHDISTTIMNEIFTLGHQFRYNLRVWTDFDVPKVKTVVMVLKVLDMLLLRFGKLYQRI